MKTTRGVVQKLQLDCLSCADGALPTEYRRRGRAWFECRACGRDVSMAVIFLQKHEEKS